MENTNDYKVLVDCTVAGTDRTVGDVVKLSAEDAASFAEGTLELVAEGDAGAGAGEAKKKEEVVAPRVLTQEDIDANPILAELNAVVGGTVSVGAPVE